jgi:alkanesulfonate monooxygenase SsuD/methylene tetrahydromethanopterin reductase-like flavin-dependent oxidoreductase (luciferase family)
MEKLLVDGRLPRSIRHPRDAARYPYTDDDLAAIDEHFADTIMGDPDTVMKGRAALVERTAASELMISTQVFDHADRCRSYELIAQSASQSSQLHPATS